MQQLILGTGSAIWWVTEPHWFSYIIYFNPSLTFGGKVGGNSLLEPRDTKRRSITVPLTSCLIGSD
jgi:hypothetical protein